MELKARIGSIDQCRHIAQQMATETIGRIHQTDTYFRCPRGRLKLRVIDQNEAQLIGYNRSDEKRTRLSHYSICPIAEPGLILAVLANTLGIRAVIEKHREVYLQGSVRIHLDRVERLGEFIEFEAVLAEGEEEREGHQHVARLQDAFGIRVTDIVAESYVDLCELPEC